MAGFLALRIIAPFHLPRPILLVQWFTERSLTAHSYGHSSGLTHDVRTKFPFNLCFQRHHHALPICSHQRLQAERID